MKIYKKWTATMLIITLVMMVFCITIDVHADVVVPENDDTHFYLYNLYDFTDWNDADFLTYENYNLYFNELSGSAKDDVNNKFIDIDSTSYSVIYETLLNDFRDPNYVASSPSINFASTYFTPPYVNGSYANVDDCEFLIIHLQTSGGSPLICFYCFYCPNGDDIKIMGNTVCCDSSYYFTYTPYTVTNPDNSGHYNYAVGRIENLTSTFNDSFNCYTNVINTTMFIGTPFCTMPYYFTSSNNSSYDTDLKIYNAYKSSDSFAVDRRTTKFINKINGVPDNNGTLGVISGSFYNIFGGASLGDMSMLTVFELNDYTKSIRNNVQIVYDYTFNFSGTFNTIPFTFSKSYYASTGYYDSYTIGSSNYLMIDIDDVLSKIRTNPNRSFNDQIVGGDEAVNQAFSLIMATQTNESFKKSYTGGFSALQALDLLQNVGLNTYTVYNKKDFNFGINANADIMSKFNWDIAFNINSSSYSQSGVVSTIDYSNLIVNIMLMDSSGNISSPFIYTYDFKTGTHITEGGFETNNIDSEGNIMPFDNKYSYGSSIEGSYLNPYIPSDYNISSGTNNGGTAYGGSSNASVGDININVGASGAAEMIIDMPADEWLQHSPNFNNLITTLKNGITSVSTESGSVAVMLKDTYAIFPIEVWGYLALAICTISSLAVIRYIRRG